MAIKNQNIIFATRFPYHAIQEFKEKIIQFTEECETISKGVLRVNDNIITFVNAVPPERGRFNKSNNKHVIIDDTEFSELLSFINMQIPFSAFATYHQTELDQLRLLLFTNKQNIKISN